MGGLFSWILNSESDEPEGRQEVIVDGFVCALAQGRNRKRLAVGGDCGGRGKVEGVEAAHSRQVANRHGPTACVRNVVAARPGELAALSHNHDAPAATVR